MTYRNPPQSEELKRIVPSSQTSFHCELQSLEHEDSVPLMMSLCGWLDVHLPVPAMQPGPLWWAPRPPLSLPGRHATALRGAVHTPPQAVWHAYQHTHTHIHTHARRHSHIYTHQHTDTSVQTERHWETHECANEHTHTHTDLCNLHMKCHQ